MPFTEETRLDAYIIPAEDLAPDYVRCGLPPEKLHPFGIPTKRAFAGAMGKAEARARLRLDPQKKYILITGGSMGGGAIKETMDALIRGVRGRRDVALIVVCGSNRELYDNLVSQRPENTVVVGYTDDMAAYMKAADIFVTKPGGLSSTEAAVCGIPILHTAGIPGCETCNAQYFEAHGMSMIGRDPEEILTRAMALLFDEQKCAAMASSQRAMADGMAAARICEFAEGLANGVPKG